MSINWGAWSDVGLAAGMSQAVKEQLAENGIQTLSPQLGIEALEHIVLGDSNQTQMGVVALNWQKYLTSFANTKASPFYSELKFKTHSSSKKTSSPKQSEFVQKLTAAPSQERKEILSTFLKQELQKILALDSFETIDSKKGFMSMGVDSLMAVEVPIINTDELRTKLNTMSLDKKTSY